MSNIKYFSFAKSSSSVPIYSYCPDKQNQDEYKIESGKVRHLWIYCIGSKSIKKLKFKIGRKAEDQYWEWVLVLQEGCERNYLFCAL